MKDLIQLLSRYRAMGVKLWAAEGALRFKAPEGVLLPAHKAELKQNKDKILAFLLAQEAEQAGRLPAILPSDRDQPLVLSFSQARLWFFDQLEGQTGSYHIPLILQAEGDLVAKALEQATQTLIQRHESLRTSFGLHEGQPVQIIKDGSNWQMQVIDFSQVGMDDEAIAVFIGTFIQLPFYLTKAPLLRMTLLRLPTIHLICIDCHHIISDGWSMGIFQGELLRIYSAYALGQATPELTPLSIQYADYATWQRGFLSGAELERQISFWRTYLADHPPLLELPTDFPRPAKMGPAGAQIPISFTSPMIAAITDLSRKNQVSLFMTLLTGFSLLLSRYSQQDDILIGSPIANRNRPEIEPLIGFFVNTLVYRTQIKAEEGFAALLARIRTQSLEVYQHQDLPFERIVEEFVTTRNLAYPPLFQVLFGFREQAISPTTEMPGVVLRALGSKRDQSLFNLSLDLVFSGDALFGALDYQTDLFSAERMKRLCNHMAHLMIDAAARPNQPVSRLNLMSAAESHELVSRLNQSIDWDVQTPYFHERFEAFANKTPQAEALNYYTDEGPGLKLSYAEMDQQANRFAALLQRSGVGLETRVGICLTTSIEKMVGVLAVLKAGASFVPLEETYPIDRLSYIATDAAIAVVLVDPQTAKVAAELGLPQRLVQLEPGEVVPRPPSHRTNHGAYVLYTSGSTGRPKGVLVPHPTLSNLLEHSLDYLQMTPASRLLQMASFSFDASVWEWMTTLSAGACLVLAPKPLLLPGPHLTALLAAWRISHFFGTPAWFAVAEPSPLPYPTVLISGGEACPSNLFDRWGQGRTFINVYGPTENTIVSTYQIIDERLVASCHQHHHQIPLGRPLVNLSGYVVDPLGQLQPAGIPGELVLGGLGVTRGYLNRAALTAEKFIPDPFADQAGARLYRSGDLVRTLETHQGLTLEFLGRIDFQVKLRGQRIELNEIEAVLDETPGVEQAVVRLLAVGGREPQLVAYLKTGHGAPLDHPLDYASSRLPAYMVPTLVLYLEHFPLTTAGKVDLKALPLPDQAEEEKRAPANPTEHMLVSIWANLLECPPEQISTLDNFFALGGHSLMAVRVINQIRDHLNVTLVVRDLFERPTLLALAELIDTRKADGSSEPGLRAPSLTLVARGERERVLSLAQNTLWFLDLMEGSGGDGRLGGTYNIPAGWRVNGPLLVTALSQTLRCLVNRHEIIRSCYPQSNGAAQVALLAHETFRLRVLDLRQLDDPEAAVEAFAQRELQHSFPMARGPLFRATLLWLANERYVLFVNQHHIIADGWSMGLLRGELTAGYAQVVAGHTLNSEPDQPDYWDYAYWQQDLIARGVLEQQLDWWHQQLADVPARLELTSDKPRPQYQTYHGATIPIHFPDSVAQALTALCLRAEASSFMALHALLALKLGRYSGQDVVCLGSPVAGRHHPALEPLYGMFVTTIAIPTRLRPGASFWDLLAQTRDQILNCFEHGDVPFDRVVDAVQPQRDLSHTPLFQVLLSVLNLPQDEPLVGGVELETLTLGIDSIKYELEFSFRESAGGLFGAMSYNTDLYEAKTAQRMARRLEYLVAELAQNPHQPWASVSLFSPAERHELIKVLNHNPCDPPVNACIQDLFAAWAIRTPNAPALVYDPLDGSEPQQLSYGELERLTSQFAVNLRTSGLAVGECVGVCLPPSLERMVAVLAVLKAGGHYVPMDPDYPDERLHYMIEDAALQRVLLPAEPKKRDWPEQVCPIQMDLESLDRNFDQPAPRGADPALLAYIIYTSGSTGRPKGVAVGHRALCNLVRQQQQIFQVGDSSRVLQLASFSFDVSLSEWTNALCSGAALYLAPRDALLPGPAVAQLLNHWRITHLMPTPAWLSAMDDEARALLEPQVPQVIISGGEACTPQLAARWAQDRRFVNAYGPTENTICTTALVVEPAAVGATAPRVLPLGGPLGNLTVYVLDARAQLVPTGVVGELCSGGAGVALGYLGRPGLTAEKYLPDAFSSTPGARLYRSGDLVRWIELDGRPVLEYLGRFDHQVKIRGLRIELGEIEAVLAQTPGVQAAVVLVQEGPAQSKALVGYVRPNDPAVVTVEQVRAFALARLPEFMVPTRIIALAEFPTTPAGKLDLKALPKTELDDLTGFSAPSSPTEQALAQIWGELLERDVISLSRNDDFFQVGGHSLLVTRLTNRIHQVFGQLVPVRSVFEHPVLADLADYLQQQEGTAGATSLPRLARPVAAEPVSFALSHAQNRLWFLFQLEPHSFAYNMNFNLQLQGHLAVAEFSDAIQTIVARHEILRTSFGENGSSGVQIVHPATLQQLLVLDLSAFEADQHEPLIKNLIGWFGGYIFDLRRRPPIVQVLIRLDPQTHILISTMHHIIFDGWSFSILTRELVALYSAALNQVDSGLTEPTVQYADFSVWQNELLASSRLLAQVDWWRTYLQGVSRGTRPEPDYPVSQPSSRGANHGILLENATVSGLTQLASKGRTTLFATMLASFALLLARHSGSEDIVLGYPMASRNHPDLEQVMGMFLNNLVLRLDLKDASSFTDLLGRAKSVLMGTLAHGDVPFERLVEELQPERNMGGHPFFEVTLNLVNTPSEELTLPGLRLAALGSEGVEARSPMNLYLYPQPDGSMALSLVYMADLYEPERIKHFLDQYAHLLRSICADPEQKPNAYLLLEPSAQVLLADPASPITTPSFPLLPELLARAVNHHSKRTALHWKNHSLSYQELGASVAELNHLLRQRGFKAGDVIALHGRRGPELVEALWAVLGLGGILVTLDATLAPARRLALLEQAAPTLLLDLEPKGQSDLRQWLPASVPSLQLATLGRGPFDPKASAGHERHSVALQGGDPAYVFFTSGSTGKPKGVLGNHRGLAHFLTWQRETFVIGPNDRAAQLINLSFDAILRDIFLPLISGATLCLPPTDEVGLASQILPWMAEVGISYLHAVPSLVSAWLSEPVPGPKPAPRLLFLSGEPFSDQLVSRWAQMVCPETQIVNFYGPTETTFIKTWFPVARPAAPGYQPAGKAITATQILILDGERLCAVGELGEITIRTPMRSSGYYLDPEETSKRFVASPFSADPTDLLYRTGDRGRFRANGDLEVLGRLDFQIKIRGIRIEPGEIQTVLERHPAVAEAVVMVRTAAQGEAHLIAWFTSPNDVAPAQPASLRKFLRERLPEAMVPSAFVALESWPLLANGKLDRQSLPEPDSAAGANETAYEAPRSETEHALAAIWTELLDLQAPCGIHDDFFALGGHSLLATRVLTRIQTRWSKDIQLKDLFTAPTIAELARLLERQTTTPSTRLAEPSARVHHKGQAPASYAQARLWFLDRFAEGNAEQAAAYHMITGLRLRGPFALAAMEHALQVLFERHESLRTQFVMVDDVPYQEVVALAAQPLTVIDLSGLAESQDRVLAQLASDFNQLPFDLSQAPLCRSLCLRLATDQHALLVVQHHSISDGWSQTLFTQEVTQAYAALLHDQPISLPLLGLTYADYAVWQRELFDSGAMAEQLRWWQTYLTGLPAHLDLSTDKPRPALPSYRGARVPIEIQPELYRALRQRCQETGTTPFMALQASLAVLLGRYANQEDITIGSPSAGRHYTSLEPLMGMFVNTLVFRHKLSPGIGFAELLRATRDHILNAFANQAVPFDYLVEAIQPERDASRSPLFQVMFVLQNLPRSGQTLGVLEIEPLERTEATTKFELSWVLYERPEGLSGVLEYNTDLFETSTVDQLNRDWLRLLTQLCACPTQAIGSFAALDETQRERLVVAFNQSPGPKPCADLYPELLARSVRQFAEAEAASFDPVDGTTPQTLTYAQLDEAVERLTHQLQDHGLAPESAVGILMNPCLERLVALLAVLRAGGYFIPLDPEYPADRLDYMRDDAQISLILTARDTASIWPQITATQQVVDLAQLPAGKARPVQLEPLQAAYAIYTSGSTGKPKGVLIAQRSLCNFVTQIAHRFGVDRETRFLQLVSFSFDASIVEWAPALSLGGCTVLAPRAALLPGPQIPSLLQQWRISHLTAAPAWLAAVDLGDLVYPHTVIPGGEACSPQLAERIRKSLHNGYGPTENTIGTSTQAIGPELIAYCKQHNRALPLGQPLAQVTTYVVNRYGLLAPEGVPGELVCGGIGVARGYLNRPSLTAEKFVPDPFSPEPGARLYRSGDLVRLLPMAGELTLDFLGRIDHQVKLRGLRIELGEIETALAETAGVIRALAVILDLPGLGQQLVAYAMTEAGQPLEPDPLVALAQRLPAYMVPGSLTYLVSFPLTPAGKIDIKALPLPEQEMGTHLPPSSPSELVLAEIWAELLDRPLGAISCQDNFFRLGGHSLLAVRVINHITERLGVTLAVRELFERPVLTDLAALVDLRQNETAADPASPQLVPSSGAELLSPAQTTLWFVDLLEGSAGDNRLGGAYNIPAGWIVRGPLLIEALEQALLDLVQRNSLLSAAYPQQAGLPSVIHLPLERFRLPVHDFRGLSQDQDWASHVLQLEGQFSFSLAQGPLFRVSLIWLDHQVFGLILNQHHIISDGWSIGLLKNQLIGAYAYYAGAAGAVSPTQPQLQYHDFAAWQHQLDQTGVLARQLDWWKEHLRDTPNRLELMTDKPRPTRQGFQGARLPIRFETQASLDFQALAQAEGATLFMALHALLALLLSRYSGQAHICVGSPVAGRFHAALESMLGMFVTMLPIPTHVPEQTSFRALLRQTRSTILGCFANQNVSFDRIVEAVQPQRELSHSPIFQVLLSVLNLPESDSGIAGLELETLGMSSETSKFELEFAFAETEQGFQGSVTYNTDLFEPTSVARMVDHLNLLLGSLSADPDLNCQDVSLLSPAERALVLEGFQGHAQPPLADQTILNAFERWVARSRESEALRFESLLPDEGHALTYAELDLLSNQLAGKLQTLGVVAEQPIGLFMGASLARIVAALAVFKAGAMYVPLDPDHPSERIAAIQSDCAMSLTLVDQASAARFNGQGTSLLIELATLALEPTRPLARINPARGAYVLFTSGSTGRPKGVCVVHAALLNLIAREGAVCQIEASSRLLQLAAFSFDVSIAEWVGALYAGATLYLSQRENLLPSPQLAEALQRWGITHLLATPSWLAGLEPGPGSVKVIVPGGEACPTQLAERWLPYCLVVNAYGPTENTIATTTQLVCPELTHYCKEHNRVLPLGQPLAGLSVYVLDRRGRLVPPGLPGELVSGGLGLARGYWASPGLTAQKFVPDPFSQEPGSRLYRSGDLVRLLNFPTGPSLDFLGRIDFQVKLRGLRIELGEIESVLAETPGVSQAIVQVQDWPQVGQQLVAYLQAPETQQQTQAVLELAAQRLPAYMVPNHIAFLTEFPTSLAGKIDFKALPRPELGLGQFEPVRSQHERLLAQIWAELLDREPDQIGRASNFFSLGGHSLLAVRVINRIQEATAIGLQVRDIFEYPVLGALATQLDQHQGDVRIDFQVPLVPVDEPAILSVAQSALWFLDQMEGSGGEQRLGGAYNIPAGWRVRGPLGIAALAASLAELVTRHRILRAAYPQHEGRPQVRELAANQLDLRVLDLRHLDDSETLVRNYLTAELQRPFNLATGPLFRATLLWLDEHDHVLMLNQHHIISDGWSMGLLKQQLVEGYARKMQGVAADTAEPEERLLAYTDFAHWQRRLSESGALEHQLAWWKDQLAELPTRLELYADAPRPAFQTFRGAKVPVVLEGDSATRWMALYRAETATPFMACHALLALLLARYSGQTRICIGSPVSGRHHVALEGMLGMFVNTLAIPHHLEPEDHFRGLLRRTQALVLGCFANQDVSLDRVVEAAQPTRDLSHPPLFQVLLSLINFPDSGEGLAEVVLEPLSLDSATAKFELEFNFLEADNGLHGVLTYNADLFSPTTAQRLVQHLSQLIDSIVQTPEEPWYRLALLNPEERQGLIHTLNQAESQPLGQASVLELFAAACTARPHTEALYYDPLDGSACASMDYATLAQHSDQLARSLRQLGVGLETRVGLCLQPSLARFVAVLAVLKAGGVYVPIDPDYPSDRINHIVTDAEIEWVLEHEATEQLDWPAGVIHQRVDLDRLAAEADPLSATVPASLVPLATESAAYIIYTSGSTGRPKGIVVPHGGLVNLIVQSSRILQITSETRLLQQASFSFDASVWEWAATLANGACLILAPRQALLPGPHLAEAFTRWKLSHLLTSPSWLAAMEPTPLPYPSVINAGSEAGLAQVAARWGQGRTYLNAYGPTEITVVCSILPIDASLLRYSQEQQRPLLLGPAFANASMYVVDRWGQLAVPGQAGELWIGGRGVTRGYLGRPDQTAEKFVPDTFGTGSGQRLYRSGDLLRMIQVAGQAYLDFLGRIDFQVKLRGQRIELAEIESVLAQTPGVLRAVVRLLKTPSNDDQLVAYLQTEGGTAIEQPLALAQTRLPAYMLPAHVIFLEQFPTTQSGKLDLRALPQPETGQARDFVALETPIQHQLADLWSEVLGRERALFSQTDHFFELGGHSLLAVRLNNRLRESFQLDLAIRDIFAYPVLAAQAEFIAAQAGTTATAQLPPLVPRQDGTRQLSLAQNTLWFLDQVEGSGGDQRLGGAYNMPAGWVVRGPLDPAALERALLLLVRRHEILRSAYPKHEGRPSVRILPESAFGLNLFDLRGLAETQAEIDRFAQRELHHTFPMASGPLFRSSLLWLAEDRYALIINQHHIISDGWSMGLLKDQLMSAYAAQVQGEPLPTTPSEGLSYWDYSAWQQQLVARGVLEGQLDWWREALAGLPTRLELWPDKLRPKQQTYAGAAIPIRVSQATTQALNQLGQAHGATPFMVQHAILSLLLSRMSGQAQLCLGSPLAGRSQQALESIYGMFVGMLPIPSLVVAKTSFSTHLSRTRDQILACFAHAEVPFDRIVEVAAPQRDLSHPPLFQVMLTVLNLPQSDQLVGGVDLEPLAFGEDQVKYELGFNFSETPMGLFGSLAYNSQLFQADSMERLARRLEGLMAELVRDPQQSCGNVNLLTTQVDRDLVQQLNQRTAYPSALGLIQDQIAAWVTRDPESTALAYDACVETEPQTLSYRQWWQVSDQLACVLQDRGVGPETGVGICMPPSLERMVAILAVLKAGGFYIPLDPEYPAERLQYMVEDSGIGLVLELPGAEGQPWSATLIRVPVTVAATELAETRRPRVLAVPQNSAYLIYTSGSTGRPKGVVVPHLGLVNLVDQLRQPLGFSPQTRLLQLASFSFDVSVMEWATSLSSGGCLILLPRAELLPGPAVAQHIKRWQVTHLIPTPAWLAAMDPFEHPCTMISGGEALRPQLAEVWSKGRHFFNGYGPTENTILTTFQPVETALVGVCQAQQRVIPLGLPIGAVTCYILDRWGQQVPPGVAGELLSGGRAVTRGYLNRPGLTARQFIPDPFANEPGGRLYRTGDLVRQMAYPGGMSFDFLGRIDHQVKLRGFRIELGEIEAALTEQASVREAVALIHTSATGNPFLLAYVTGSSQEPTERELIREQLKQRLPEYMVPANLIHLAQMPKTPAGKIDRTLLANQVGQHLQMGASSRVLPRNATESQLALLWSQLLGHEQIGVTQDFFELGGHSLLAVQLADLIQKRMQRKVAVSALFLNASIESQAKLLDPSEQEVQATTLVALNEGGPGRPWFLIHPVGGQVHWYLPLAKRLAGKNPVYGLQSLGLYQDQAPRSLDEMTADYLAEIQQIQPEGPYQLLGWSAGGTIALALAEALEQSGQKNHRVVLLDAFHLSQTQSQEPLREILRFLADLQGGQLGAAPERYGQACIGLETTDQIWQALAAANLLPEGWEQDQLLRFYKVYQTNLKAVTTHNQPAVESPCLLIRASASRDRGAPANYGWTNLKQLEQTDLEGDHYTLLDKAHAEALAATLDTFGLDTGRNCL